MIKVFRSSKEIIIKDDDNSILHSFECDEKWSVEVIASKGLVVRDDEDQTRLVLSPPFVYINCVEVEETSLAAYAKAHLGEVKKGRVIIGYSEDYGLIVSCKNGWNTEGNRFISDTYLLEGYDRALYMKIENWKAL